MVSEDFFLIHQEKKNLLRKGGTHLLLQPWEFETGGLYQFWGQSCPQSEIVSQKLKPTKSSESEERTERQGHNKQMCMEERWQVADSVQKEVGDDRARGRVTRRYHVKVWNYQGTNLARTKAHPSSTNNKNIKLPPEIKQDQKAKQSKKEEKNN